MKPATVLSLATVATAFIVPDEQVLAQLPIHDEQPQEDVSWLDWLPSAEGITSLLDSAIDTVDSVMEEEFRNMRARFESSLELKLETVINEDTAYNIDDMGRPPHGHKTSNLTIYQLISESKHTTKFAKLVDEYDDIVQLLNSTSANYTLFVPIDEAFEHIHHPHEAANKPSKEFISAVLKYHIGLGLYPAGRVLTTHTLPSALTEPLLGDKPQRLRTSAGLLSGVRVNFYSQVVAVDYFAQNGVIHAVNRILVPPPPVATELSLLPSRFSTLLLAVDKTNFTGHLQAATDGSTVFAPDNAAFAKLGPAANAFLFNTQKGLGYLKALLKYHVVPDATVYSDAYYSSEGDDAAILDGDVGRGHYHLDVPTLLGDKTIAIDVARWAGFIRVQLNGYIRVTVQDGIAKNGVVHLPGRVLIPPHKDGKINSEAVGEEVSVEELMERLAEYVDDNDDNDSGDKKVKTELEL